MNMFLTYANTGIANRNGQSFVFEIRDSPFR